MQNSLPQLQIQNKNFLHSFFVLPDQCLFLCNWDNLSDMHSEQSAPGTIWKICTRDDPNDLHLGRSKQSAPEPIQTIFTQDNTIDLK